MKKMYLLSFTTSDGDIIAQSHTKCKDSDSRFIQLEMNQIQLDRWNLGQITHDDPGNKHDTEWVDMLAPKYRFLWENSYCKDCQNWNKCGQLMKLKDDKFGCNEKCKDYNKLNE